MAVMKRVSLSEWAAFISKLPSAFGHMIVAYRGGFWLAPGFLWPILQHEEGIVIKSLDSKWVPGDRSGHWCKLKPDYLHKAS